MKRAYFVIWMLVILITACSNEDENETVHDNPIQETKSGEAITFAQDMGGVSVLIFNLKDNSYKYERSITSGWSADGKVSTRLELGDYKFLFIKSAGINTILYPNPLGNTTTFDQIKIDAKPDTQNTGYILPVDEIWLPETKELAERPYTITGPTTVKNRLTRAVGQIVVNMKRAAIDGTDTTYISFPANTDIMKNIKDIKLDIAGIGQSINIEKGSGNAKTIYDFDETEAKIDTQGFASLEGPFVFPTVDKDKATVKVTITPSATSAFPEMSTTVEGKIERNKKLEINILITSTYQLIGVTVNIEPISKDEDGDMGIWE